MNVENLTDHGLTEYGTLLNTPNRNIAETEEMQYCRSTSVCNMGKLASGLLKVFPREMVIKKLERHLETNEIITVLSGGGILCFAAPGDKPEKSLRAFRFKQGDSISLFPGTWHSLMLPENNTDALLLILFKEGTEDTDVEFKTLSAPKYLSSI